MPKTPFVSSALHRFAWRPAALAVAVSLSGCMTVGPDYQRPSAAQPDKLPLAWRTVDPEAVRGPSEAVNAAWWRQFGDPHLAALIDAAIDANKDLRVAAYKVEEFKARVQMSNAAAYPQVGYSVAGQRQQRSAEQPALLRPGQEPAYNNSSIGITFSWEADWWGRVRRSNEAAMADLLSTEESRRAVMLSVVSDVAAAYLQLVGLDRELAIARETLRNREEAAKLLETKQKGGSATKLAVAQARALVDEVAATIPSAERQIAMLEHALSALAGRPPGPVTRATIQQVKLPSVPAGVPSDLLDRRPDVLAAEQALVAANARIGVAKAQYFPTLSLTGALGLASDQLRWLLAKTARTGEFTRTLAGTLFDGGRIAADVAQNEALQKQMTERYLQAILSALQEVEDSLVYAAKSREANAAHQRQVASLQEVARLSRLRYDGGEATFLEVLDAERQVFAAQTQAAQGQRDQYLALVAVYKAMGGGWMAEQDRLREQRLAAAPSAPAVAAPTTQDEIVK